MPEKLDNYEWLKCKNAKNKLEYGLPPYAEENGNALQYSCLENPIEGVAWWATVHGVAKSQTRLSNFTFAFSITMYKTKLKMD